MDIMIIFWKLRDYGFDYIQGGPATGFSGYTIPDRRNMGEALHAFPYGMKPIHFDLVLMAWA